MWAGCGTGLPASAPQLTLGDIVQDILTSAPSNPSSSSSASSATPSLPHATNSSRPQPAHATHAPQRVKTQAAQIPRGREQELEAAVEAALDDLNAALLSSSPSLPSPLSPSSLPDWVSLTQQLCAALSAADAVLLRTGASLSALPGPLLSLQALVQRTQATLAALRQGIAAMGAQ